MEKAMRQRTVLVTGAASGIGRGIALRFGGAGARIVASDIDADGAETTASMIREAGGEALSLVADVSTGTAVDALVERAAAFGGGIDAVVCAAGVWHGGTVLAIDEAEWDRVMAINLKSLYWLARAAYPHLKTTAGCLVAIASTAGLRGTRGNGAYNASKAAVIGLAKNLALDFAPDGIRVNCICPGLIETPMGDAVLSHQGGGEAIKAAYAKAYPLGRLGTPEDVAAAALFLASTDASWITGTALVVDGGAMAGG